jgi:hypothetical protein
VLAYQLADLSMAEGAGFEPAELLHPLVFQTSTRSQPGRSFRDQFWRRRHESNVRPGSGLPLSRRDGKPTAIVSWRRVGESNAQGPLSEPTPVRAERTCQCAKPSVNLVPAGGIEPPLSPYERDVLPLDHAGESWSRQPELHGHRFATREADCFYPMAAWSQRRESNSHSLFTEQAVYH